MTHTYLISGMTCSSCEAKVKSALFSVPDVTDVAVSKETNSAQITMDKHIALSTLQNALSVTDSKYTISALEHNETVEITKSFLETYKPVARLAGSNYSKLGEIFSIKRG